MKHQTFDLEAARADRHAAISRKFEKRHPERAREERKLRRHNAKLPDRFGHRREGTLQTLDKASRVQQGALARMFVSGHLSADQLAFAAEIKVIAERIGRDVAIGTVSLETRVDCGGSGRGTCEESLGRVRREVAYSHWRADLDRPEAVLAMIVDDIAVRPAAQRFRMRDAKIRKLLTGALDAWPNYCREARARVDALDLAIAQARLA